MFIIPVHLIVRVSALLIVACAIILSVIIPTTVNARAILCKGPHKIKGGQTIKVVGFFNETAKAIAYKGSKPHSFVVYVKASKKCFAVVKR
jgi:hypothetical protein